MLKRLIEYVLEQPVDGCGGLLLQDMALCRAWAESCAGETTEADRLRAMEARLVYWQGAAPPEPEATSGRRQQMLLRDALGRGAIVGGRPCHRARVGARGSLHREQRVEDEPAPEKQESRGQKL